MTEDNTHANDTNPCLGICATDTDDYCIGCFRTWDERERWYNETDSWRELVLAELKKREEDLLRQEN